MLKIAIHSRLHLTLLAMHCGEYRQNGGLGFAIADPKCELTFSTADDFVIIDQRINPLANNELARLLTLLQNEQIRSDFSVALKIVINGNMRPHAGFGSGTTLNLACLEALHILNDSKPSAAELIAASGRGSTSGVGIRSYFSGGYVFDLGRTLDGKALSPSHQVTATQVPLLLDQRPMPDWAIGLCMPLSIEHMSQAEERAFFERTCPLPAEAVYETVYHSLFGLYAALRESDWSTFCLALRTVQVCAWKNAERLEYGANLMTIEQALYNAGAEAVGMSSLGPSLFFLANDVAGIVNRMRNAHPDCEWLVTRPDNSGRMIAYA